MVTLAGSDVGISGMVTLAGRDVGTSGIVTLKGSDVGIFGIVTLVGTLGIVTLVGTLGIVTLVGTLGIVTLVGTLRIVVEGGRGIAIAAEETALFAWVLRTGENHAVKTMARKTIEGTRRTNRPRYLRRCNFTRSYYLNLTCKLYLKANN
jgi:hypothetical protein